MSKQYDPNSIANTIMVALGLCIFCSTAVSVAAVSLKDRQDKNALLDMRKNILNATGIAMNQVGESASTLSPTQVDEMFTNIEAKLVDLETGSYLDADEKAIKEFNPDKQEGQVDIVGPYKVGLAKRGKIAKIFIVKGKDDAPQQVVIPIYGKGLWSTLKGFLALDKDLETVKGITFYEHKETPGLGGEVDNPKWKKQWQGLSLYDSEGKPAIGVNKGPAPIGSKHLVDGLSGATITSRGVNEFVRYWVSENGFAAYLNQLKSGNVPVIPFEGGGAESNQPVNEGETSDG